MNDASDTNREWDGATHLECIQGVVAVDVRSTPCSAEIPTTELLAIKASSGDDAAFAALVREFRPRLVASLCKRMSGRLADAEDVAQDALSKAWMSLELYDSQRAFSAWLFTIAYRMAIDLQRRRARERRCFAQIAPRQAPTLPQTHDENATALWATAQRVLSEPQYTALWLRYGEDFSIAEIAGIMGRTGVGVRALLHRARQSLRPYLARFEESPEGGIE